MFSDTPSAVGADPKQPLRRDVVTKNSNAYAMKYEKKDYAIYTGVSTVAGECHRFCAIYWSLKQVWIHYKSNFTAATYGVLLARTESKWPPRQSKLTRMREPRRE